MYYQNYHKHTSLSHRYNKDSSLVPMDYINAMKPLAEQGIPQIYSTLEHGWQSNYFHIYNDLEAFNNKNKDKPNYKPIKFIFGTEAYWVEDRLSKDGSNNHIVLLAKNDNGRKKLNRAIYESFKTGYYYKGRMDLDILLNLPKDDIFCTSACIAFWLKYAENGWDKIDDIVLKLNDHFTDFYLEVQANNTDKQKKVNEHILDLHYKYNIPIIGATDSHEISLDQMDDRDYLLKSNHITYEDEDGNYMDFPSYDTLVSRFQEQGILNNDEITECLNNTNKILDFEDIILDRSLKVPVAKQYRGLTQEERNQVFKDIIVKEWKLQKGDINKDKLAEYKKENAHDFNEIIACNMADYFIDSYLIMKRGQELGGILTDSGRGSSVSFFLNKLLRLTKVDKVNAPVTMYSERFLTATRILESKVPPDVDNNVNAREPFIEAQKEIVGEEGTFDLLALGTLKYKSAFKMYARAHDLDVETQNIISKQIDQYETALKYAKEEFDDDEIDISIYDYVDEKYRELIDGCQQYRGIVDTLKSHPCFTKDALVMTDKGYKPISDIQIGDNVLTVDNDYHKVTRLMNHEATDIYILNLQGSENFEVTSNHPFFTAKRKNISSHIHGESRRELTSYQWKEVKDLVKGDLIGVAINQKSVLPQLDFVDATNKNFWWTLGRYFGDGWKSHTVRLSGKRTGDKVKDVIICCNKNNNEANEIINKLNWCSYRVSKENTVNKIYIHCQGLYEWLEQFGDYARGKHFNNTIYDLPIDYLREFLNGYLSADGHIDSDRNCHVLTTINKELAYGVIACVHKVYHTPCRLVISKTNGKEIICGRTVNAHPRYRVSFKFYSASQDRAFYKDKYMWYPFVGKELLNKTETVYNLEVEENHTYTVYNYIVHNCGTLCYSGNAIEDVGVIMVKSESTGRECFVALQESATIDSFGFLKQDYLVVDTVSLISDIYKEIGMKSFTINELLKEIDGDKLTWDIYSQGRTMCINQVEQEKSTQKVMRYKPQNISELCSFIAGIRPSFKSMYNIFESRRHFDYGIKAFDNLLQDEYRSSSFIFYQEDLMKVLGFAGFPMKDTYTIIKAISKKKKHVIEDAKVKFIPNFTQAILDTKETQDRKQAEQMANKVWTIIENSASYGFNCVAGDTIIVRGATNKHKPLTVEEMWLTLNDKQWAIKHGHKSLHEKYNRCGYGTALSMGNDNRIYENHIIDITRQPKAQLYIITTESGKQIKTTINHKFPTINGIKTVDKLQVGDSLYIMGEYEKCTNRYVFTDGNFEKNLPKKGQQGFQHKENGDSVVYDNFRNIKLAEQCVCEDCGQTSTRYEVHHIDFDRTHNSFDNYAWLCPSCHKKRHYANGRVKRYEKGIPTYTEKIVSIELGAIEYVYDVSMSNKVNHNYVANDGIVTCNCSHSFCMAIDSVTLAWQKAHYPLEFYKVALQRYTDKGEKNKVIRIKKEMQKSGITLNDIAFGQDNRKFSIDKTTNSINQTMASIKDTQKTAPQELYELQKHHYDNFLELLQAIDETSINSKTLTILICLNYFSEFGNPNQLLEIVKLYNKFGSVKVLTKSKLTPQELEIASKYAHKATEKQLREIDTNGLLNELIGAIKASTDPLQQICYDVTYLGYTNRTYDAPYYAVTALETNNYGTTYISLYNIQNGSNESYKLSRKWDIECEQGDILEVSFEDEHKHIKDDNGNWVKTDVIEKRIKLFNVILKNPKTK